MRASSRAWLTLFERLRFLSPGAGLPAPTGSAPPAGGARPSSRRPVLRRRAWRDRVEADRKASEVRNSPSRFLRPLLAPSSFLRRCHGRLRRAPRCGAALSPTWRGGDAIGAGMAAEEDGAARGAQPPVGLCGPVQGGVALEQEATPSASLLRGCLVGRRPCAGIEVMEGEHGCPSTDVISGRCDSGCTSRGPRLRWR